MSKFEFYSVAKIVFGRGQFARAGELAAGMGRSAMVISNAGQAGDGGLVDRLTATLDAAGVRQVFLRQRGEPKVSDVQRGLALARQGACDMVIGLGGGSAIDAAKAVAGLLTNGGSVEDYMEVVGKGRQMTRRAAPWMAIPTTSGTGAEVTRNAVIGCPEKQFKASLRSEHLLARVALVDPELGVAVPPEVTARAGMDALCQLIESYTSTGAGPVTDALAVEGVALAGRSLRRAYLNGSDLEAREEMALAALLGGIALTNAGLGAVHGFAAPLGANFPAPHGAVCAALLGQVIAANIAALRAQSPAHPALKRYAAIGRTLAGKGELTDAEALEQAVQCVRGLAADLHIPPLGQFGVTVKDVPMLVALARKSSSMRYNPVALPEEMLAEILRKAL